MAVIVDTKVSKKAVERNLLKRRVRAHMRARGLPEGWLVIRLLKGSVEIPYATLTDHIDACLRKISSSR